MRSPMPLILAALLAFFGVQPTDEKQRQENLICECVDCDYIDCDCGQAECEPVEPQRQKARNNEIVIYTMPNCPACDAWKAKHWDYCKSVGWKMTEKPLENSHSVAPSFRVWLDGNAYDHSGFMIAADLKGIQDKHAGR